MGWQSGTMVAIAATGFIAGRATFCLGAIHRRIHGSSVRRARIAARSQSRLLGPWGSATDGSDSLRLGFSCGLLWAPCRVFQSTTTIVIGFAGGLPAGAMVALLVPLRPPTPPRAMRSLASLSLTNFQDSGTGPEGWIPRLRGSSNHLETTALLGVIPALPGVIPWSGQATLAPSTGTRATPSLHSWASDPCPCTRATP